MQASIFADEEGFVFKGNTYFVDADLYTKGDDIELHVHYVCTEKFEPWVSTAEFEEALMDYLEPRLDTAERTDGY